MTKVLTACVAAIAALSLSGCGSNDDEAAPPTTPTVATTETTITATATETETEQPPPQPPTVVRIAVRAGAPVGGIARQSVSQDDRVVLLVTSDVADHVHVHGYDLFADVSPSARARIAFRATIPGRFEIELEDSGLPIAELTVRP